jgi:signal transduction histidine kinase/DNA-binding response OmpR family regulator
MLEAGEAYHGEITSRRKDGQVVWNSLYISPLKNEKGKTVNYISIEQDITEKKKAEVALQETMEAVDAANRAKGEFLANMSHEIRTPMNAVIGLNQLMMNTEQSQKQKDYTFKISLAAQNLLGIINDILDFSKIEAGKLDVEFIPFNLDDVLDHLSNIVNVKASNKDLEIIIKKYKDVPVNIVGDPLRLGQVLLNLANNALKFTEKGEIIISIRLKEQVDDSVVLAFSIKDTGIGMTEEQVNKLFKPFTQADASTTRKYGGTGLGLTISKNLIEMMGGQIDIQSEYGKGSTFSFTIQARLHDSVKAVYALPDAQLDGLKVMIVDDNENARIVLADYLETFSFDVTTTVSGEEALGKLVDNISKNEPPYQLILMDWKLGGINGLEACGEILKSNLIPVKPKLILVTAYGNEYVIKEAEDMELDGTLFKPVSQSMLFDMIMNIFGTAERETGVEEVTVEHEDRFKGLLGTQVLVVEDNAINQQVAREFLENKGVVVDIADDGKQAIEKLRGREDVYDVVLMDVQMPFMDGYETTHIIREELNIQNLPIIAMTADAMKGVDQECLEAGMNDYISKPLDIVKLYDKLKYWIDTEAIDSRHVHDMHMEENSETVAFPQLECLNVDLALRRLGGNSSLLKKLIFEFIEGYSDKISQIQAMVEAGKSEEVYRLAHAISGISGNLDAKEVYETASKLADASKRGDEDLILLANAFTKAYNVFESEVKSTLSKDFEVNRGYEKD